MKHRYTMSEVCHLIGTDEADVLALIDDGRLVPEGYGGMNTQRRLENQVHGTYTFLLSSIEVFFQAIYRDARQWQTLKSSVDRQSNNLSQMMLQLTRMEEFLVLANTRISLKRFSEETGISLKYIHKRVERFTDFTGILRVSGLQLPLIKEGRQWTVSLAEYLAKRRSLTYDVLRKAQREGEKMVNGRTAGGL